MDGGDNRERDGGGWAGGTRSNRREEATSKASTTFPGILLWGTSGISNVLHLLKSQYVFKHVIFFFPKYLDSIG